jgi:hypothetical protein
MLHTVLSRSGDGGGRAEGTYQAALVDDPEEPSEDDADGVVVGEAESEGVDEEEPDDAVELVSEPEDVLEVVLGFEPDPPRLSVL